MTDNNELFVVESEISSMEDMLRDIAAVAYPYVLATYHDLVDANGGADGLDDHELYLYVYQHGGWIIEHAQYLTDHRGIVAVASVGDYVNVDTLYYELDSSTY
jgi:hypothetical protein